MTYSQALARRVREQLARIRGIEERKMFGGICFLLNGNICVGVWHDSLIARIGAERYADALQQPMVHEFDITGRAMTGWVLVEPEGIESDDELHDWTELANTFVRTLRAK